MIIGTPIDMFMAPSLITCYDFHNDRTWLSLVLGCGSLGPPPHENIMVKYPMTVGLSQIVVILYRLIVLWLSNFLFAHP